ncbi:hypothetical protein F5882DRAFT_387068 [Hyaloscypha sp. PMI_1271]|nr:hypothetical protein F5882DRAFT_387068 [Hyaloscypha sp. PMI_1271]
MLETCFESAGHGGIVEFKLPSLGVYNTPNTNKTCAVRLDSFAVRREYDSAHGAFIRPSLASSDVDGMAFSEYAGKASIVFEMCFTAASTGGLKFQNMSSCVGSDKFIDRDYRLSIVIGLSIDKRSISIIIIDKN